MTSRYGTLPRAGSTPAPRLSVMVTLAVPLPSSPPSPVSRMHLMSTTCSPTYRWPNYVMFNTIPTRLVQLARNRCPATTSLSGLPSGASRKEQMEFPVIRRWLTQHPLFVNLLDVEHRNMISTLSSHSTSSRMLHAVLARRPSRLFWSIPRLPLESSCWSQKLTAEPCSSPSLLIYIEGHIFRAPETLRSLTRCNCVCKVITAAMCFGLRRNSIECMVRCNSIDSPK